MYTLSIVLITKNQSGFFHMKYKIKRHQTVHMAKEVEHLLCKRKALSSNLSQTCTHKKLRDINSGCWVWWCISIISASFEEI
jgi:hypothetical protein